MRLLTYDELPESAAPTSALTQMLAFGQPFLDRQLRVYRRGGFFAPYAGVFAVEGGEVIGQAYCLRYQYRFRDGVAPLAGIAAVATRPDHTGRGLARQILEEIHRRERADGIEHIALWTNRSWAAHGVYERLGYRDVYHPCYALRRFDAAPPRRGNLTIRKARVGDIPQIEALHQQRTRGRPGFSARSTGFLGVDVAADGRAVLERFWVAARGRTLLGYSVLEENPGRVFCSELVTRNAAAETALLGQYVRRTRGRWGALAYSVAQDRWRTLPRMGYTRFDRAWFVLMGARTDGTAASVRSRVHAYATDDPRWVCFAGDRF